MGPKSPCHANASPKEVDTAKLKECFYCTYGPYFKGARRLLLQPKKTLSSPQWVEFGALPPSAWAFENTGDVCPGFGHFGSPGRLMLWRQDRLRGWGHGAFRQGRTSSRQYIPGFHIPCPKITPSTPKVPPKRSLGF